MNKWRSVKETSGGVSWQRREPAPFPNASSASQIHPQQLLHSQLPASMLAGMLAGNGHAHQRRNARGECIAVETGVARCPLGSGVGGTGRCADRVNTSVAQLAQIRPPSTLIAVLLGPSEGEPGPFVLPHHWRPLGWSNGPWGACRFAQPHTLVNWEEARFA